jgi:hypothetical protein
MVIQSTALLAVQPHPAAVLMDAAPVPPVPDASCVDGETL